jgi:hypothetical protein
MGNGCSAFAALQQHRPRMLVIRPVSGTDFLDHRIGPNSSSWPLQHQEDHAASLPWHGHICIFSPKSLQPIPDHIGAFVGRAEENRIRPFLFKPT